MLNNLNQEQINSLGLPNIPSKMSELWSDLYPGIDEQILEYRYAPSIIVRGECEILGRSYPRFAVRVTIPGIGFVNFRRKQCLLKSFSENKDDESAIFRRAIYKIFSDFRNGPEENFRAYFADCLLVPPSTPDFQEYHFITADLWDAYGESELAKSLNNRSVVPFMHHIRLGGGMCAQAACFIVSLLYQQEIRGIYGIPEITEISQQHKSKATCLDFGGLHAVEVRDYFRHPFVGLHAFIERFDQEKEHGCLPHSSPAMKKIAFALRSYVLSGVPVILPVNIEILRHLETSQSSRSGESESLENYDESRANHCVVVSGVGKKDTSSFIITDPARLPFIRCTINDLCNASQITHRDGIFSELLSLWHGNGIDDATYDSEAKDVLHMIPVVPCPVKLPFLINIFTPSSINDLDALYVARIEHSVSNVIRMIQNKGITAPLEDWKCRLINWSEQSDLKTLEGSDHLACFTPGEKEKIKQYFASSNLSNNHWYWLLAVPKDESTRLTSLYIIDAESSLPLDLNDYPIFQLFDLYVKGALDLSSDDPAQPYGTPDATDEQQIVFTHTIDKKPDIAILSSFHTNGFRGTIENWQSDWPKNCELYTFMNSTAADIQEHLRASGIIDSDQRNLNATEFLAQCGEHQCMATVTAIADVLHGWCVPKEVKFVSFASFLPGLSHGSMSPQAITARKSLIFLATLCFQLQSQTDSHPISKIELVSGSRMQTIGNHAPNPAAPPEFIAKKMSQKTAHKNLIFNLVETLKAINNIKNNIFPHCSIPNLALEAEPGPLFSLSSLDSIFRFCRALDDRQQSGEQHTGLLRFVGINLDVAHWLISENDNSFDCQSKLNKLRTPKFKCVLDRICGAHISGTHRAGHFGDIAIEDITETSHIRNGVDQLQEWIKFISERMNDKSTGGGHPRFDGHLVLEIEAAKSTDSISSSLSVLQRFLACM